MHMARQLGRRTQLLGILDLVRVVEFDGRNWLVDDAADEAV